MVRKLMRAPKPNARSHEQRDEGEEDRGQDKWTERAAQVLDLGRRIRQLLIPGPRDRERESENASGYRPVGERGDSY